MNLTRKAAISAGVLFIIATVTDVVGTQLSAPTVNGSDYLTKMSANANQISAGALLEFIAAGSCAGIAIALFPVLRDWSVSLALGSVVFRSIEAAMYAVAAATLLSVLAVSHQFIGSGRSIGRPFKRSATPCWPSASRPLLLESWPLARAPCCTTTCSTARG